MASIASGCASAVQEMVFIAGQSVPPPLAPSLEKVESNQASFDFFVHLESQISGVMGLSNG